MKALTKKPDATDLLPSIQEAQENPDARKAAKELLTRRTTEEPGITVLVTKTVEDAGGQMEGLEYRLKSEDSITRKILDNMAAENLSVEKAVE